MHTVLENLEMVELGGVGQERTFHELPGDRDFASPEARLQSRPLVGSSENEIDESVVFPGDNPIDDPALLEMRPARPQREIDLEALDYHLQGYSVRQIAKLQDVHSNTAFNRIKRGRELDAKDPLRAEGASLHAQANKLRQLERAFLPAASEGDIRSAQLVLRIVDKLWRLGKFAREAETAGRMSQSAAAVSSLTAPMGIGTAADDMNYGEMPAAWQKEFVSWDYLSEMLPDRAEEVAKLRQDIAIAEKADDEEFERKMQQQPTTPLPVPPRDELAAFKAEYARPVKVNGPSVEQPLVRRPLTKKEKALHARGKRGQGASAARTEREQSASAGAYSGAEAHHDNHRENGDIGRKRAG